MAQRVMNDYKKIEKIAEGAYGKVYVGLHVASQQYVAMKKVSRAARTEGLPCLMLREISLLRCVSRHDNVVELLDVFLQKRSYTMVFPFYPTDLKRRLAMAAPLSRQEQHYMAGGQPPTGPHPLSARTIIRFTFQIANALQYCHARNIIHRDLKPDNVLVCGDDERVKVADFGLARVHTSARKQFSTAVVTLWYRSPELLLGEDQYAGAVDVWALGCMVIEMFELTPLFSGDSEIDQLARIFRTLGMPTPDVWPNCRYLRDFKPIVLMGIANASNKVDRDLQEKQKEQEQGGAIDQALLAPRSRPLPPRFRHRQAVAAAAAAAAVRQRQPSRDTSLRQQDVSLRQAAQCAPHHVLQSSVESSGGHPSPGFGERSVDGTPAMSRIDMVGGGTLSESSSSIQQHTPFHSPTSSFGRPAETPQDLTNSVLTMPPRAGAGAGGAGAGAAPSLPPLAAGRFTRRLGSNSSGSESSSSSPATHGGRHMSSPSPTPSERDDDDDVAAEGDVAARRRQADYVERMSRQDATGHVFRKLAPLFENIAMAHPLLFDMTCSALVFDPARRSTAHALYMHPCFKQLREREFQKRRKRWNKRE